MHVSMPGARPPRDGPVEMSWSEILMVSRGLTHYLAQQGAQAWPAPPPRESPTASLHRRTPGVPIDLDEHRRRRQQARKDGGHPGLAAPRAA